MVQQDVLLNEQTIFNYMIDLLINEGGDGQQYIRFDERKHKEAFIKYMLKCYEEYKKFSATTDIREQENYKNKYQYYSDEELTALFNSNLNTQRRMDLCLFYDAVDSNVGGTFYLDELDSKNHWLIRVGDVSEGSNFRNSAEFNIWGMKRGVKTTAVIGFEYLVKKGDILWFIPGRSDGYALAFAEYVSHCEIPNEQRQQRYAELGWNNTDNSSDWNIEINYKNLTYTNETRQVGTTREDHVKYCTHIIGNSVMVRRYDRDDNEKCTINLPEIYKEVIGI
jgi:hypothetical protein